MMRILGGKYRQQKLTSPKGSDVRPTSSLVRNAVFNMCQHCIDEARFLDICAGSGTMGLEALSRGASFAGFIEHSRNAIVSLKKNMQILGVEDACTLYFGDALVTIKNLNAKELSFDICYFDPPYTKNKNETNVFAKKVLEEIDKSAHLLRPEGLLFLEESLFFDLSNTKLNTLSLEKTKKFGNSQLFCFRKT